MIKLKKLIKESTWANRKFGEPLPTVKDYKEAYDKKNRKLNEATYIKQKAINILRHAERSLVQPLIQNISESPDALDSNPNSAKNAMKQISKAWIDFKRAVEKANKPVEKNYTGV